MDKLLQADIFFFITTVAVVSVTILLVVALVYLIKILRDISFVSKSVKKEGAGAVRQMANVAKVLFTNVVLLGFVRKFLGKKKKQNRRLIR